MSSLNVLFIKNIIDAHKLKIDFLSKQFGLDLSRIDSSVYFTEEEIRNYYYKNGEKIKIKKKFPDINEFASEYAYFIKISELLNFRYQRYNTLHWEGPCIVLNKELYSNDKIHKIKRKYQIELNMDYLSNNHVVIYPKKYINSDTIIYQYSLKTNTDIGKPMIILTEWTHENKQFYIDINTDNVYTIDDNLYIGKRVYKDGIWSIYE